MEIQIKHSNYKVVEIDQKGIHIGKQTYFGNDLNIEDIVGEYSEYYNERYKKYYNKKTKHYPDGYKKVVYCNNKKFRIALYGTGQKRRASSSDWWKDLSDEELSEDEKRYIEAVEADREKRSHYQAMRRAQDRVFDIVRLNYKDLKLFVTVTFDKEKVNSLDPVAVIMPLLSWLKNMVYRYNLMFVLVPEYHKSGRIHCHLLTNKIFNLVDSGTRIVDGFSQPVKLETIEKYKIAPSRIKNVVYNIPEWKYGFSTAIETYGDSLGVACYIAKYMTKKDECEDTDKVFGKRFWSSRNMKLYPDIELENISAQEFRDVPRLEMRNPYGDDIYKYYDNSVKKEF